jgi:integrase
MRRRLPKYCCEDTDRHGNVRVYFRKRGQPKVRLHGTAWTPAFMEQYTRALNGSTMSPARRVSHRREVTWEWLCKKYMISAEFRALKNSTTNTRRRTLEWTWEQPIHPGATHLFGDMPVSRMDARAVRVLRDRKAETKAAANLLLKTIGYVYAFGLEEYPGLLSANPVRDVRKFKYKAVGWHTWTPAELTDFMEYYPPGSRERRAMALMLYTGARGCDARKFGPQLVEDGWLRFHQQKLIDNPRGWVELPLHEELVRELDLAGRNELGFILTQHGQTYSQKGFGNWFNQACRNAGLPGCTAHGLRKAAATIAVDNGATVHQLMAMFGWMTEQQATHYTKEANRRRLAASAVGLITLEQSRTVSERTGIQSVPPAAGKTGRWDKIAKIPNQNNSENSAWRSHGESNPGFSLERAAS